MHRVPRLSFSLSQRCGVRSSSKALPPPEPTSNRFSRACKKQNTNGNVYPIFIGAIMYRARFYGHMEAAVPLLPTAFGSLS